MHSILYIYYINTTIVYICVCVCVYIYIYMSVCVWLINYDMHGDNFINIPSFLQSHIKQICKAFYMCIVGAIVVQVVQWLGQGSGVLKVAPRRVRLELLPLLWSLLPIDYLNKFTHRLV